MLYGGLDVDFEKATCFQWTRHGRENIWFSEDLKDQQRAIHYCQKCPVQIECAILALENHPTDGIWAGRSYAKEWNSGRKPNSDAAAKSFEESGEL